MVKKITVLLAAHNGEKWIEKQINSILESATIDLELIIGIDKSTDSTFDLCMAISKKMSDVISVHEYRHLGSAAKNFFELIYDTDFSNSKYVFFSDQDDIWNKDKIFQAIEQLSISNCEAYSSNVTAFWPGGRSRLINKAQPQVEWDYLFESAGPGCTFVLTQSLALALQNFIRNHPTEMQTVWMHDWFIYAFARANAYRWIIDPQPTMQYRQHANNQVGVNLGLKAFKHRAAFIVSGKWFKQAALIATLVGKSNSDFVKGWLPFSRLGFIKLAFQAQKCRRKRSEQVWFFCICVLLAITGVNISTDIHNNKHVA